MNDIKVFIAHREVQCAECGEELGRNAWITLDNQKGAVCLSCADLEHLAYLPAGNTALTRRARKNSRLSAVVLKWSRARKQYERQGVLVEEGALQEAEAECAADETVRAAERRAELDEKYIESFARRIRDMYPGVPVGREKVIAVHACRKYSGRVGRSSSAKTLDAEAVKLAVIAHLRHMETDYDVLLTKGYERYEAREQVRQQVEEMLDKWQEV